MANDIQETLRAQERAAAAAGNLAELAKERSGDPTVGPGGGFQAPDTIESDVAQRSREELRQERVQEVLREQEQLAAEAGNLSELAEERSGQPTVTLEGEFQAPERIESDVAQQSAREVAEQRAEQQVAEDLDVTTEQAQDIVEREEGELRLQAEGLEEAGIDPFRVTQATAARALRERGDLPTQPDPVAQADAEFQQQQAEQARQEFLGVEEQRRAGVATFSGQQPDGFTDRLQATQQQSQFEPQIGLLGQIEQTSRTAAEGLRREVVQPGAEVAGDVADVFRAGSELTAGTNPFGFRSGQAPATEAELGEAFEETGEATRDITRTPAEEESDISGIEAGTEELTRGAGTGAVQLTAGLPAGAIQTGRLGVQAGEFTAEAVEEEGVQAGLATAGAAGLGFATQQAEELQETAAERPLFTLGTLAGSGGASAALSPFRISRVDIPTQRTTQVEADIETQRLAEGVPTDTPDVNVRVAEGPPGSTTVRGLRVQAPRALERFGVRTRGRTLAGARGARPTIGAPSIEADIGNLDLSRIGATPTRTVEAGSAFEADVFRATTRDVGGEAAQRFEAAESVMGQAARRPTGGFEVESPEEAISQARAVPETAAEDVTQALRDVDATVFGSAAVGAQIPDFRQPRDVDIVVPDEAAARPRLEESLEGETATVSDVFDIKETADVPGRARGGEEIKFGFTSREPRELGGVRFNPAEEELIRKAGASAFIRERGAAGTEEFDVGPEPRAAGRPDVREKDVTDAEIIASQFGPRRGALGEFREAFDLEGEPTAATGAGIFEGLGERTDQPIAGFIADERAETTPFGRFGEQDVDIDRPREIDVQRPRDTDVGSPGRADTDIDTTIGGPSPFGIDTDGDTDITSPSTGQSTETDSPPSPTTADDGFGGVITTPSPDDDNGDDEITVPQIDVISPVDIPPIDRPTPGLETPPSPPDQPTIPPSPPMTPSPPDMPTVGSPFTSPESPGFTPASVSTPESPAIPGTGPQTGGMTRPLDNDPERRQRATDERDDELPEGTLFENPVASGEQFLFGTDLDQPNMNRDRQAESAFETMFGVDGSERTQETTENLFGIRGDR